jgi:hypothetical protein
VRVSTVSFLSGNVAALAGVDAFITNEAAAVVTSLNRFGKLAWERTAWPFSSVLKQVVPDVRVRSIDVGDGGSSYSSAPTVAVAGAATATSTINSDGEVNGIAVTAGGTGYVSAPAVTFSGGGGSGAVATANLISLIDMAQTMDLIFRITDVDPYGGTNPTDLAYRIDAESGATEYGLAILENRSSTAPVWVHYRTPWPGYASGSSVFPYIFGEYATMGAYGDWLQADGQASKAAAVWNQAEGILQTELDQLERQQRQTAPLLINTYGTTAAQP